MIKRLMVCVLAWAALLPTALAAEAPLSRGELMALLWKAGGGVAYDKTAHPFSDLDQEDDAIVQAVAWGYGNGLVRGVGSGRFAPRRALTREECATVLRRYDALLGRETFLPDGAAGCNDNAGLSPWADDSLYWACITRRMDWQGSRLAPHGRVTRAEAERWLGV